jgi:hypothetical protein
MKKILLMLNIFLASTVCSAGQVLYPFSDGTTQVITYDDKYSFKNFGQRGLLDATDLEGKVIYASSFAQENPNTAVFPQSVKTMTFYNCNLDNVKTIKPGWTVVGGSERKYKVQNDKKDWVLDNLGQIVEVMNKENWVSRGFDVDKNHIPVLEIKDIEDGPKAVIISPI